MTVPLNRLVEALAARYRVERELGSGGMATVYLADDLRHRRKVAVKVLKDDVSATVGAARFLREIEIAAQLQHPHILPLLDSGELDGIVFYVMPFVEGESLRQRLTREGELPVGDALRVLVQVTDALAYAHARGVVHRDIKPDNIMLSGRHAVVMDFGVARAVSASTTSGTLTSIGMALGTPAYMAPEQALADPHVDQRADIYALGVVGYEMLAGRTPFMAASAQQMLAAHVTGQPEPLSRHRPGLAPALEQALMRCLEKRPADRFQTSDELLAILEPLVAPSGGTASTEALRPAPWNQRNRRATWFAAAGALAGLAALALWIPTRSNHATLALGRSTPVTSDPGLEIQPDISPDGRLVAFAAGNFARMRIYVRPVAGGRTIPLSDDSMSVETAPRWSPDGSHILFQVRGGLSVAPSLGGTSRPIAGPLDTLRIRSADWSPDGNRIVFVRGDSVHTVGLDGGHIGVTVAPPDAHSCAWSARNLIACVSQNSRAHAPGANFGNLGPSAIVVMPAAGGPHRAVTELSSSNSSPVWSADGRQLFFISNRDGPRDIYAVSIDASGAPQGSVRRLTTGLGAISISLSGDGTRLAYAAYSTRSNLYSLPIPQGAPVSADGAAPLTFGNQVIEFTRVSADGRWILYDSNLGGRSHIWRVPIDGGQPEQLTRGPADEFAPDLSPDGRFVAYHSWRTGTRDVEVLPLAGGEAERVTNSNRQESAPSWSLDGNSILFVDQSGDFETSVTTRQPDGGWSPARVLARSAGAPRWSPDNTHVLYADMAKRGRLLAIAAAGGEPRVVYDPGVNDAIPTRGAIWARDGLIYFKAHDEAGRASFWRVRPGGARAELLVRFDDLSRPSSRADFDVDGRRFYFPIETRESDVYVVEIVGRR